MTAPYTPTTWTDNGGPALDAANLDNLEAGIAAANTGLRLVEGSVAGALPAAAQARTNLGLGTAAVHAATDFDAGRTTTDAVVYVSTGNTASDANDGLAHSRPKATVEAALAALPATGGRIELGYGTYTLAATGATTGLTITPGKPVHFRGLGRFLSTMTYTGTGVAVQIGTGANFLDWGSFIDCGITCTANAATTGVNINNAHRGYFERFQIIGIGGNPAGSNGMVAGSAYQNYIKDSLIYGFSGGVLLNATCQEFSILDTSIDGTGIVVHVIDSSDVRIKGGQITGAGASVAVQVDAVATDVYGFMLSGIYFDSGAGAATISASIGPAATSTFSVVMPDISTQAPHGIVIDRATQPIVKVAGVLTGSVVTLTAHCTDAFVNYALNGGSLSDSGVRTNKFNASGAGSMFLANLTLTGHAAGGSYTATSGAPAYDYNPATASGTLLRAIVAAEANERVSVNYAGQMAWGAGGSAGTDLTISRGAAGVLRIGGSLAPGISKATLAASGAVVFDARYGGTYVETLQANATSSTINSASQDGHIITVEWQQDATGGRTYAWPANCRFAGGVAPSDTTASTKTSVTFRYDATAVKWYEQARAVAVPV